MTQDEAVKLWRKSAERNLDTAKDMVKAGHRDWALFIGQLSLEKLLKGLIVKNKNETPPFIHDLVKLSELADIDATKEQQEQLAKITRFHVAARYDDIKSQLYHEATPAFTTRWMGIIEELFLWISKHY